MSFLPKRASHPVWSYQRGSRPLQVQILRSYFFRCPDAGSFRSVQGTSPCRVPGESLDAWYRPRFRHQPQHFGAVVARKRGHLPALNTTLVVPQPDDAIELDEVWSFVQRKGQQAWVWIAIAYQSRQVLALVVGDRSAKTCRKLWERIPAAYRALRTYSDFWQAYLSVIPRGLHQRCKKGSGQTNTIERFNLTMRQRVGRLVRKSLSFSKSWAMHLLCLRLFVDWYNRYCLKRFRNDITDKQMLVTTQAIL